MSKTFYRVVHPSGQFVCDGDYRPKRYWSLEGAIQRARVMSAIYEKPIEIRKFPDPYMAKRFIDVRQ